MKKRVFQSFLALTLILTACLCLTGCNKQNYQKAVTLYNEGHYDDAAILFAQLGDYEDSAQLQTRSQYWAAITLMDESNYDKALPRFVKLGNYEDSALRVIECKYQMAIAEFEAEDLKTAESYFLEQPQYRQTPEYLRRITWQKFYDAVKKAGSGTDGGAMIQKALDGAVVSMTATDSNQLILFISTTKDMGYIFYDDLTLTLNRNTLEAMFTANSSFSMDFVETQIGSKQTASGRVDISACTGSTQLVADAFQMTVTDNLGITSTSEDPADCLMTDAMADNLAALLTEIPQLLSEAGIEWTLADIGFPPNT